MKRKQRLELEVEQVRNEARELREAFRCDYAHRDSWRVVLTRLWHQFWHDLAAINRAATADHKQANRAGHTNHHQRKKLKGWQK